MAYLYKAKAKGFFNAQRVRPDEVVSSETKLDPVPKWLEPIVKKEEIAEAAPKAKTAKKGTAKKGPAVAKDAAGVTGTGEKVDCISEIDIK